MIKLCDINEQANQTKSKFGIHKKRYYTPDRFRQVEGNKSCIKRSVLFWQKEKIMLKTESQFTIRSSQSKSWKLMKSESNKMRIQTERAEPTEKNTRNVKKKSLAKIEVLESIISDLKLRYLITQSKLAFSHSKTKPLPESPLKN